MECVDLENMTSISTKGSYTASGELTFETTLTTTILTQVFLTAAVLLTFSLLKWVLPAVYCPRYLRRRRGWNIWFVEVLIEPIANYARCGNVAAIFVLFQGMLIILFGIMVLVVSTVLLPIYYFGTDQSFGPGYRTFWSRLSIMHIENESYLIIIPVLVAIGFGFLLTEFYAQFLVSYVYFRQRALRRAAPHNYVVMLEQLPKHIRTFGDLTTSLQQAFPEGMIEKIVCSPKPAVALSGQYKKLLKIIRKQNKLVRMTMLYQARLDAILVQERLNPLASYQKSINKLQAKLQKTKKNSLPLRIQARKLKCEILSTAYRYNVDLSYLQGIENLPPDMPQVVTCFNRLTTCRRATGEDATQKHDQYETAIEYLTARMMNTTSEEEKEEKEELTIHAPLASEQALLSPVLTRHSRDCPKTVINKLKDLVPPSGVGTMDAPAIAMAANDAGAVHMDTPIGRTAFLICKTQVNAFLTGNSLIYMNAAEPRVSQAPEYNQINWKNTGLTRGKRTALRAVFWSLMIILFASYFVPQTLLLNIVARDGASWFESFYNAVCPALGGCVRDDSSQGSTLALNTTVCLLCHKITSMCITLLPTIIQVVFMTLLPMVISKLAWIPHYTTLSQKINVEYHINFIFLIMIVGVVQILLSSTFDVNGVINLGVLPSTTLLKLIGNVGENITAQIFTFLNYLITKYFLFSVLSLLRLPDLLLAAVKYVIYLITKDPMVREQIFRYRGFPYLKQLAYGSHMLVIGMMYAVIAPISVIVVFITYTVFSIVNRFNILFVYAPLPNSEMSSEADIIRHVSSDIFFGYCLMMITTASFLAIRSGLLFRLCALVLVIFLTVSIARKCNLDMMYRRAMFTIHLSTWGLDDISCINPYNPACNYLTADDTKISGARQVVDSHLDKWVEYEEQEMLKAIQESPNRKLASVLVQNAQPRPDINMNSLRIRRRAHSLNLWRPPISYMRRTSLLHEDFQCEVADESSIQTHELTVSEVRNIATMYTHPAYAMAYVYGIGRQDGDVR